MLEINPVLAGTFDQPGYLPTANNLTSTATEDTSSVDSRRYTNFDRTAADSGSTTSFSFSDLLDLINPLEHIPLVSSAYRAISGDSIHPLSQIAGDIMYGAVLGAPSAIIGGAGAIVDRVIQAQTGKNSLAYAADVMFGASDKPSTKIAAAAEPVTVSAKAPIAEAPSVPSVTPAATPAAANAIPMATAGNNPQPSATTKAYPLDRGKLPFGGVIDMGNAVQAQDMAIALSEGSPTMRLGHTIYTNRLLTGAHPAPAPVGPAATTTPSATATSGNANINLQNSQQLPQALLDDIIALKALNQYKSSASTPTSTGSNIDITN